MFQRFFDTVRQTVPSVDVQEAWTRLSLPTATPVLIDVREPWEYTADHAKNAKNIPLSKLQQREREIPRDREVLLICQSGHRSLQAAKFLQQQGIARVVNVKGGTTLWKMHQLPME